MTRGWWNRLWGWLVALLWEFPDRFRMWRLWWRNRRNSRRRLPVHDPLALALRTGAMSINEVRAFQRDEIARVFAVPPHLIQGRPELRLLEEADFRRLAPFVRAFAQALEDIRPAVMRAGEQLRDLGTAYAVAGQGALATASQVDLNERREWPIWVDSASWTGRGWGDPGTGFLDRLIWMVPLTFVLIRKHGYPAHGAAHYARSLWDSQLEDYRRGWIDPDEFLGPLEALAEDRQHWEVG